jgi:hypothetical protein
MMKSVSLSCFPTSQFESRPVGSFGVLSKALDLLFSHPGPSFRRLGKSYQYLTRLQYVGSSTFERQSRPFPLRIIQTGSDYALPCSIATIGLISPSP